MQEVISKRQYEYFFSQNSRFRQFRVDQEAKKACCWLQEKLQIIRMLSSIEDQDRSPLHGVLIGNNYLEGLYIKFKYLFELYRNESKSKADEFNKFLGTYVKYIMDEFGYKPTNPKMQDYFSRTFNTYIKSARKYVRKIR